MTRERIQHRKLRMDKKAISPAISAVMITSMVAILVLVTVVFANGYLNGRLAENEFGAMKQFMQTVGLQIDDVAWIPGRAQTIRYASKFGQVNFEPLVLRYTFYVNQGAGYVYVANYSTGILLYNMQVSKYTVANDYHERIFPLDNSFLQNGTSAPISDVFVIEKLPMYDGDFIRVVAAPTVRMLTSMIFSGGETVNYSKFYLPVLSEGVSPRHSQSVTLTGETVLAETEANVNAVRIEVSFLAWSKGFGQDFFDFDKVVQEVDVPDGSVVEFYVGEVTVSLGLYA